MKLACSLSHCSIWNISIGSCGACLGPGCQLLLCSFSMQSLLPEEPRSSSGSAGMSRWLNGGALFGFDYQTSPNSGISPNPLLIVCVIPGPEPIFRLKLKTSVMLLSFFFFFCALYIRFTLYNKFRQFLRAKRLVNSTCSLFPIIYSISSHSYSLSLKFLTKEH